MSPTCSFCSGIGFLGPGVTVSLVLVEAEGDGVEVVGSGGGGSGGDLEVVPLASGSVSAP